MFEARNDSKFMIIAIDETGSFDESSNGLNLFIAVQLRQRKHLYRQKERQFMAWESSIDSSLKNPKGEIKTSRLSDDQLLDFARRVMISTPWVGITPIAVCPAQNPATVMEKYRQVMLRGIHEGEKWYREHGRPGPAQTYLEFGNWLKKLNYQQFMKVIVLSICIVDSFTNAVGHSISGRYDDELTRLRFKIDRDFIRGLPVERFWRELLRNGLYNRTLERPLPIPNTWKKRGHPFLKMYEKDDGTYDFNQLFTKHCSFGLSHEHFEIRISDGVNTIFSRYLNGGSCAPAYTLIRHSILRDGKIIQIVLGDSDLSEWRYDATNNQFGDLSDG